jgi:hypothetical protein
MYLWAKCLAFYEANLEEEGHQARLLAAKVVGVPFNTNGGVSRTGTETFGSVSEMIMGSPGAGGHDFWGWTLFFDACLFSWLGGSMLCSHVYLVLANLTTNEAINWKKYPDMRDGNGKYKNAYDKGPCSNFMERVFLIGGANAGEDGPAPDPWSVLGGEGEAAGLMSGGVDIEMTESRNAEGAARSRTSKRGATANTAEAEETEGLL